MTHTRHWHWTYGVVAAWLLLLALAMALMLGGCGAKLNIPRFGCPEQSPRFVDCDPNADGTYQ